MTAGMINTRDLRLLRDLLDLANPASQLDSLESTLESTLSTVKAIVPCDAVTFHVQDLAAQRVMAIREVSDRYEVDAGLDDAAAEEYWDYFWASDCCYPQRSGDYFSVVKTTDFEPGGSLSHATGGPVMRSHAGDRVARVTLPLVGAVDYRIVLWRIDGRDFSDQDIVLLSVLRPTLVAIRDRCFLPQVGRPELTPRQLQLLGLVATGLTNRQAARQLGVSEHTVRKHVENIFERLQVTSRTAAIHRVFPGTPPS